MGPERLFLSNLTDEHLRLLLRAVEWDPNLKAEWLLEDVKSGKTELWWSEGTLAGFQFPIGRWGPIVWIEFVVGDNYLRRLEYFLHWTRERWNLPIEANVTRPGLVRLYSQLGFRNCGVWMKFDEQ